MEKDRIFFPQRELDDVARRLISSGTQYRENIIIPRLLGPVHIKTREEKLIEATMESCAFKSGISCVLGNVSFPNIRNKIIFARLTKLNFFQGTVLVWLLDYFLLVLILTSVSVLMPKRKQFVRYFTTLKQLVIAMGRILLSSEQFSQLRNVP